MMIVSVKNFVMVMGDTFIFNLFITQTSLNVQKEKYYAEEIWKYESNQLEHD